MIVLFPQAEAVTYVKFHSEVMGSNHCLVSIQGGLEHVLGEFLVDGKKSVFHSATNEERLIFEIRSDTQTDVQTFQTTVFIESIKFELHVSS